VKLSINVVNAARDVIVVDGELLNAPLLVFSYWL